MMGWETAMSDIPVTKPPFWTPWLSVLEIPDGMLAIEISYVEGQMVKMVLSKARFHELVYNLALADSVLSEKKEVSSGKA